VLVEPDALEERNLNRHLLGKRSIGKNKARAMRSFLRERTTTTIYPVELTVSPETATRLTPLLLESDFLVNATGHPVASTIISRVARDHQVPVIHAGVFDKGAGGYVFYQDPRPETPCYDCLFHHTRRARPDDNATLDGLTRHYGFTPEQLERQLGLFADVNVVASIQAKVIIDLLKQPVGTRARANLWRINNHHLGITTARVPQDPACTSCRKEPS
jgi:molybdopterin/thiamine biosynthesis adenylyltransferase